jgi:8-oxo-dGTP diphosphatase
VSESAGDRQPTVDVVAGALIDPHGRVLIAERPPGKSFAGRWEFPGGKRDAGESARAALARELAEELGLVVRRAAPGFVQEFVYPHAHVELHFFRVFAWDGEPVGHDGQAFVWQMPESFDVRPLLPANTFVLRALLLPRVYGISMAEELGETAFFGCADKALGRGLKLIQLREKGWPMERQRALAVALVALARPHGAKVLLNGEPESARAWGCDGVHLTSAALAALSSRPEGLVCGASCHTRADIERAGALGLDFAVLGPVLPTPTHADTPALGWDGFAAIVEQAPLPVFALGGLTTADLPTAIGRGAHGVALRRAAWRS